MKKHLGIGVASLAIVLSTWEWMGIADGAGGVPTISRVVQGVRDGGLGWVVSILAYTIAAALAVFGAWVVKHFKTDHRSSL